MGLIVEIGSVEARMGGEDNVGGGALAWRWWLVVPAN